MADFSWIAAMEELSPAALTVRAQTLSPNNNGELIYDGFFPRANVDSTDLRDITTLDFRPVAGRREWNANGRIMPRKTPNLRNFSIIPVEMRDPILEQEMQKLAERTLGSTDARAQIRNIIGASIPDRTDALVEAVYRGVEVDALTAWALGIVRVQNPETGEQYEVTFDFAAERYQTAPTAFNSGAINAYDEFTAWIADAIDAVGPIEGVMIRLSTLNEILKDAPAMAGGERMTRARLASRVSEDTGSPFTFFVNENMLDFPVDGGTQTQRRKEWPDHIIAAIPGGRRVGRTAHAPVVRATEILATVPQSKVDVRGVTVYHEPQNAGKGLELQAQLNALSIPDEGRVFVLDAGA